MNNKKQIYLIFLLISFINLNLLSNTITSFGLTFCSHSVPKESRTSLHLNTEDHYFILPEGFTIDFDIKFREELHNFGYIFRIITNDDKSFDLVSNFSENKKTLSFIEGKNIYYSFKNTELNEYNFGKWAHVRFTLSSQKINLSFNGNEVELDCNYPSLKKFMFYFGLVEHNVFGTAEVPTMTIRNISIKNNKSETIAFWPLREHADNMVYDTLHNLPAKVLNPIWEIDKHTKWKKEAEFNLPVYTQSAYDVSEDCFYLANKSFLLKYDIKKSVYDTIYPAYGNPFIEQYNQLIYHPYEQALWSYDFDLNEISVYNFEKNEWSYSDNQLKNPNFSQHNTFISPRDSALYTFGGYGNYRYKNTFQKKYGDHSPWQQVNYEEKISPRYLSGLGHINNDSILIFGGYGNETGIQELGTYNYYDLYTVDINTFSVEKKWTLENQKESFVVGSSLIVNPELNVFFALCFPNNFSNSYILLKSFDLNTGACSVYADTIPFSFDDVNSYCTLHLSKDTSMLYALISLNQNNISNVQIYSLAYSPLNLKDIYQKKSKSSIFSYVSIAVVVFVLLAGAVFIISRKEKKGAKKMLPADENSISKELFSTKELQQHSSILLLGGFQVWNNQSENITNLFTPILKQLIILIILYSKKDPRGISNTTLRETLWADKPEDSFLNNRRVSIHKLKGILEGMNDIEIEKNNIFWSINIGGTAFCDYTSAIDFMNKIKNTETIDEENIKAFPLDMLSKPLLPYTQKDWLDDFKSDYSNKVLDTMIILSKQSFIQTNNEVLIRLADIMFAHDKTDEYALTLKCKALWNSGKISLAKSVYDSFCNEYKSLLDIEYPKDFKGICG